MFYNTFCDPCELTVRVHVKTNYRFKFASASCISTLSFVICLFVTNDIPDCFNESKEASCVFIIAIDSDNLFCAGGPFVFTVTSSEMTVVGVSKNEAIKNKVTRW